MSYSLDVEIDLLPVTNNRYIISSYHRSRGRRKSDKCIWVITREEEVQCFIRSMSSDWGSKSVYWGLKLNETTLQVVGRNYGKEELKIGKFVSNNGNNIWHGYPADYLNRTHDIPDTRVLQIWVENGYIGKSHLRKIRQGMPCNL